MFCPQDYASTGWKFSFQMRLIAGFVSVWFERGCSRCRFRDEAELKEEIVLQILLEGCHEVSL